MLRVNQAGEVGANLIYQGQMFVLGNTPTGPLIKVFELGKDFSGDLTFV